MHLSNLLTSLLVTLGLHLVTLTSAAALDTTTSTSTSDLSSTYSASPSASTSASPSASPSASTSKSTSTSPSNSTAPQTIKEYIKDKLSQNAGANDNSTTTSNITSIKRVQGHGMTIEVPTCCWNGCRTCSSKVCGKGANGCNEWPYYSCCATIIIWDIGRDAVLDAFTTAGETVEFRDD
ncbi:hypothetical protein GE21DRAFT_2807 [Neurospora crassa]|uniref:Uncharacterized protein n=1 Tax=Neurospora crassa (strain ATCC 24698 / 74-OR23-1A / CBS 708.71 / DSM 1257 / FGSC 987) TaxID=367110 RepID=Q1K4U4_NEUCR|nr:hypothetical protein NCU03456 [Neurospora crassa OR74A]EAA26811.2 hypothetical protein NCU03456 [Neurospora crassa OR74A]KHE86348.1 hypothetical protein GE21DRAFT_2807 [Neurospora crassa]|eukprot:XP_956047.2 hypothetical protein NCU03456 [Neurospora crassa OR74A]